MLIGLGAHSPQSLLEAGPESLGARTSEALDSEGASLISQTKIGSWDQIKNDPKTIQLVGDWGVGIFDRKHCLKGKEGGSWHGVGRNIGDYVLISYHKDSLNGLLSLSHENWFISTEKGIISVVKQDLNEEDVQNRAIEHQKNHRITKTVDSMIDLGTDPQFLQRSAKAAEDNSVCTSFVDFVVFYTNGFADKYGSDAVARAQFYVDYVNQAFFNSGIRATARMVYTEEVEYPDTTPDKNGDDGDTWVAWKDLMLRQGEYNPGVFDHVADVRDAFGGDVVVLLRRYVAANQGACGVSAGNSGKNYSGVVVQDSGLCDPSTLAHELGHNYGCNHDRNTMAEYPEGGIITNTYPFANGYQEPTGEFVTVMSYDWTGPCKPSFCPTIPYFSNPMVEFEGMATGIEQGQAESADNALAVNLNRHILENYFPRKDVPMMENVYFIPELKRLAGERTRINLVNPHELTTNTEVFLYAKDGTNVGSYQFSLAPERKLELSTETNFAQVEADWAAIGSSLDIVCTAEYITSENRAAFHAAQIQYDRVIIPHVAKQVDRFQTILAVVNPEVAIRNEVSLMTQPFSTTFDLPEMNCSMGSASINLGEVFQEEIEITDWAEVAPYTRSAGIEYFSYLPELDRTAAIDLNSQPRPVINFLHVATDVQNFWTGLVYLNVGSKSTNVEERYYSETGALLRTEQKRVLADQKVTILFDEGSPANGTAWVQIVSIDQDYFLVGYELFGSANTSQHSFFAGLGANDQSGGSLIFPSLAKEETEWTGLVLVNLGVSGSVTIQMKSVNGNLIGSNLVEFDENQKKTVLLSELFTPEVIQSTGYIKAEGTHENWAGFQLWGDLSIERKNLAGILAFTN
jgi:hypothetical protein